MLAIEIDMSKATFHAALDDLLVRKFKNTNDGINSFLDALQSLGHAPVQTTIAVESTGVYHLLFCMRITGAGYTVMIVNLLEAHYFVAAKSLRQQKTDTIDAKHIRAMALAGVRLWRLMKSLRSKPSSPNARDWLKYVQS
jgi:transposase